MAWLSAAFNMAADLVQPLVVGAAEGLSKQTQLKIVNNANVDVINTKVTDIDAYDWDGWDNRPDNCDKFEGIKIRAKTSVERRLEVKAVASNCPITMEFQFADGTSDVVHWNQKHAIDNANLGKFVAKSSGRRRFDFQRDGDKTLVLTIN